MGRKTISLNHPWHYFDISFAFSPKAGMNGLLQNLASTPNRPSARCKTILCPSTLPNWRNAVGLKSYAGKALFKGSSKKNWHTDLFAVKDKPLSTTKIPKRSKLTSILMWHVTVTKLIHNTLMVTCHKSHSLWHPNLTAKESKATPREGVSYAPSRSHFSLWYDTHHRSFNRPQEMNRRIEPTAFPAYQSPMVIPVVNVWNFGP